MSVYVGKYPVFVSHVKEVEQLFNFTTDLQHRLQQQGLNSGEKYNCLVLVRMKGEIADCGEDVDQFALDFRLEDIGGQGDGVEVAEAQLLPRLAEKGFEDALAVADVAAFLKPVKDTLASEKRDGGSHARQPSIVAICTLV